MFSTLQHSQMQGYFFQTSFQAGQLIYRPVEVAQPLSPNFVCLCQMAACFSGFKMAFPLFQSKRVFNEVEHACVRVLIAHNESQEYLEDSLLWLTTGRNKLLFRAEPRLVVGGQEEQCAQECPYVLCEGGQCYLPLHLLVSAHLLFLHLLLPLGSCFPWG